MAIIYSYPSGGTALGADRLLITRIVEPGKDPRNYNLTIDAISAYTINSLTSGGTTNTLPIFSGTGLADSFIRQDAFGIIYIGPEDDVRFTGTSVNAPFLIGTDLYITNIYANNSGLLRVQGNTVIGNEVTDTLVVNSVSTFNSAVNVNGDATFNRGATFNDNVLIETATDVDNLKIVSTNTSSGGAPDIVLLADVPAVTGDSHGDILFQGQNGMVPGAGNILTYTGLFSKMFDKDNNHSSLVMTTHKGNGSGAQALTATFSAKGTNNAATGTLLINPSSVTDIASYNLEVKGDALVQDNLIVDNKIGIRIANPQRELDVDGGVRIRHTLDLFQGNNNSFAGQDAGNLFNIVAGSNTGFGKNSQAISVSGSSNTSMGLNSLGALVTGNNNTAIGTNSTELLNGGSSNVALGSNSLVSATAGNGNTAIGHNALQNKTTTNFNTAVGIDSLANITTGFRNVAVGNSAGEFTSDGTTANTTTTDSIFIGSESKSAGAVNNNQIVIGHNAIGKGNNTAIIGNDNTTALHVGGNNAGIVLKSPNGTAYTIRVSDAGVLVVS